jgi:hypothetical protein
VLERDEHHSRLGRKAVDRIVRPQANAHAHPWKRWIFEVPSGVVGRIHVAAARPPDGEAQGVVDPPSGDLVVGPWAVSLERDGYGRSELVSTTSKLEPDTWPSVCSWSFDQPRFGAPEMYQSEPLSATIIP